MNVAVCALKFRLPENHSLKGKRQIVWSITARLQNRFHVSAAEVEGQGLWQVCTLGISYVSNRAEHARETIDHAVSFVIENYPDIEVLEVQVEVIPVF
jgi:uncharacterized protein YlxP (DUF503 family)